MSHNVSKASHRKSEEEFEKYRAEISSLYTERNRTLSEVVREMKEKHGFYATKNQFVRKLKEWRVIKHDTRIWSTNRRGEQSEQSQLKVSMSLLKSSNIKRHLHSDYTVGWMCALPVEMKAAQAMLDVIHSPLPQPPNDQNVYVLGEIAGHKVVIACLPSGALSTTSAAIVALQMLSTFPEIRVCLLVGIGGGVPRENVDIRLGDVVVSTPTGSNSGVIKYNLGERTTENQLQQSGSLLQPPSILSSGIARLRSQHMFRDNRITGFISTVTERYEGFEYPGQQFDQLFGKEYHYAAARDTSDNLDDKHLVRRIPRNSLKPRIHYGVIASGNQVIRDANIRDSLALKSEILCFEMEAAGLPDNFPCLVIKGICDYADSHKNKTWQGYAAATAAAYTKELLGVLPVQESMPSVLSLVKTSSVYGNYFASIDLEQTLSKRASKSMISLNWQNSVVDLLKLLNLDSTLPFRRELARILDVHVGADGSGVQNIALHHAIMQELARNNGNVPRKWYNQLDLDEITSSSNGIIIGEGIGPVSFDDKLDMQRKQSEAKQKPEEIDSPSESDMKLDDEEQRRAPPKSPIESRRKKKSAPSESGESELGSIFSEETRNSSRSSSEGFEAADKELAYMFLTDAKMKPLFQCALSKVNLEKFSRNFKRLIVHYGRNLEKEASEELRKQAARYVRHSAHQVTMHIKRAMILEVRIDQLSKAKQVNDWLESLQRAKESPSSTLEAESEDQDLSSGTDSDESEVDEDFCSQTLSEVQAFMTTAEAFETLRDDFQQWLETGKRQSCKVREQQPAESHPAVSTQGPSDNPCLGENDGLQNRCYWTRDTLSPVSRVWKTIVQKIMFRIVPLLWTKPPKDYKRITWLSALGRPLYIDVKELAQGAAERLQERFRSCAMNKASPSSQSSSDTSVCVDPISTPPPAHLRADTGNSSNINQNGNYTALTDVRERDISQTSHERRYLLLCFSTHQSETFRQVDVTNLTNDQFLFSCIRDIYFEIKKRESWYVKVPLIKSLRLPGWILWLLGDLHFFTPKEVNFVSFSLLPRWTIPSPVNIKSPSLPPEIEVRVHRNWHYHPCPREFEDFQISETFVLQLFEPGHSFLDNTWLDLFPKKLRSGLVYEPGRLTVAWGIQIVEGLDKVVVVWVLFLICVTSGALAVLYSACTRDVGGAFAIAAYLVGSSTLLTIYFQLKR